MTASPSSEAGLAGKNGRGDFFDIQHAVDTCLRLLLLAPQFDSDNGVLDLVHSHTMWIHGCPDVFETVQQPRHEVLDSSKGPYFSSSVCLAPSDHLEVRWTEFIVVPNAQYGLKPQSSPTTCRACEFPDATDTPILCLYPLLLRTGVLVCSAL
jgi:hypothetical protein